MPFKTLLAFDFDCSLIDEDSDRFIFEKLSPPLLHELLTTRMQWTDLVGSLLEKLHQQGVSKNQIVQVFKDIKMDPQMLKLLDFAALEKSFHLAIISDSNQVYIESVLNHFNVRHLFTHIITNPAHFDEGGCLRVRRMIPANATQHNCPNGCSLNICKGNEIDKLIPHYDRILYVGDGRNDFCPSTKLRPVADAAFIRKDFGCDKYMIKNNICLKNKLVKWSSYEELFELIKGET